MTQQSVSSDIRTPSMTRVRPFSCAKFAIPLEV
jgi:hypothetical protein